MKTLTYVLLVFGFIGNYAIADNSTERNLVDSSDEGLSIEKRIFGGLTAARNEYPYVAKLSVKFQQLPQKICSGVALTTKIIITLAHCVTSLSGEKAINVRASFPVGGWYLFENGRNEIIVHPNYNGGLFSLNFAILRKDWPRLEYIRGLGNELPTIPDNNALNNIYDEGIIAGWGKSTELSKGYSKRLQYAPVTLMDPRDCSTYILNNFPFLSPENELLCSVTNIAGICIGDEGGPLLVITNNRPLLLGLSVARMSTCDNRNPTIPSLFYDLRPKASEWLRNSFPELS